MIPIDPWVGLAAFNEVDRMGPWNTAKGEISPLQYNASTIPATHLMPMDFGIAVAGLGPRTPQHSAGTGSLNKRGAFLTVVQVLQ